MAIAAGLSLALASLILWAPDLPAGTAWLPSLALGPALLAWHLAGPRGVAVVAILVATTLSAARAVDGRLPSTLAGADIVVRGSLCDFPRQQEGMGRFVLEVQPDEVIPGLPARLLLNWYEGSAVPAIGERWQFKVRLKLPRGLATPGAYDFERWLFTERIGATGYVRASPLNRRLGSAGQQCPAAPWRGEIARRIGDVLAGREALPYVLGLAVGAYQALPPEEWSLLRLTGTIHLISISGFHIALVAAPLGLLGVLVGRLLLAAGISCVPRVLGAWAALMAGIVYGVLAGSSIPTIRSVAMLAVAGLLLVSRYPCRARDVLGASVLVVQCLDPLAPLSPGFWLSYAGVILLLAGDKLLAAAPAGPHERDRDRAGVLARALGFPRDLLATQAVIMAGLAPLLAVFFGQLPLTGALANLIAVPLFSFAIVPATLLGAAASLVNPAAARIILKVAASAVDLWRVCIGWCADLPLAVIDMPAPGMAALALSSLGVACLLWPRPWPSRFSAVLMLAAMLSGPPRVPPAGGLRLVVLDVGQGLAVLVQTSTHSLLYDAGPAYRGGDAGERVVLPALRAFGVRHLDVLLISHGDADHRGGAPAILRHFPGARLLAAGWPGAPAGSDPQPCQAGLRWEWDGVVLEVIHPPADALPASDNNGSCVLLVRSPAGSVLLPGDIEGEAESGMIARYGRLAADLVVVPHHGSRTSSARGFIAATGPRFAAVSSGYGNRWKFPAPSVEERWRSAGACVLNTAADGSLLLEAQPGSALHLVARYRVDMRHLWTVRGPAADPCA